MERLTLLNRGRRGPTLGANSECAIARAFGWRRLAALAIVLASVGAILPQAANAACPSGSRALTFTNKCGFDVYLGQNLSSPQLQSTGTCSLDSDCNPSGKVECVDNRCSEICTTDQDCGPNQVCFKTTRQNAAGQPVNLCYFKNFEPTTLSNPSSGSGWQLPAYGGKSQLCIPEGPTVGAGGIEGAPCGKNSDCISHTCAGGSALDRLCTASDSNCKCKAVFTWSGAFWGRTDCSAANKSTNKLKCQTGNCGAANGLEGNLDCNKSTEVGPFGPANPVLQGEYTLEVPPKGGYNTGAQDFYDNSGVNGFNVGYSTVPVPGTFAPPFTNASPKQCGPAGAVQYDASGNPTLYCSFNLLSSCPENLKYKNTLGTVVGCWAPTQACVAATEAQKLALGCTRQVPFLCTQAADCPYNSAGTAQTMTCARTEGEEFGSCKCAENSDCPSSFTCSLPEGKCVQGSKSATWADLYGCNNFYNLSPYNNGTTGPKDTGRVCGCPTWTDPSSLCLAHNVNWEKVPAGRTGAGVTLLSANESTSAYYTVFHNSCSTAYAFPYDDQAGTYGCTNAEGTLGPSYNITFCPALAIPARRPPF